MQMKTIAMMTAVGCAAAILTGCGVPQEDFDAKAAELTAAQTEIKGLEGKNADLESLLNSEQGKVRKKVAELKLANKNIAALKTSEAKTASTLADEKSKSAQLERKVSSAQSATSDAQDLTEKVETKLADLQEEYQKLQARFDQFEKNMNALTAPPKKAAAPAPESPKSAMDLLNEMSAE